MLCEFKFVLVEGWFESRMIAGSVDGVTRMLLGFEPQPSREEVTFDPHVSHLGQIIDCHVLI